MGKIVSFTGKGGTGKTTVTALTIRKMIERGIKPLLAVDADPNTSLGEALGFSNFQTIGSIRERFADDKSSIPPGMTKSSYFEMVFNEAIEEGQELDLLVMGRPEGPGCYCFVNNVLRKLLEQLSGSYKYVIIDNEAGMEHLSRHNTSRADFLFIVAQPNISSIRAARRIETLCRQLELTIKEKGIVVNSNQFATEKISQELIAQLEQANLNIIARIPYDEKIIKADINEESIFKIESNSPALAASEKIVEFILKKN